MHLKRLCREHGIVQFTTGEEADLSSGFCLDDDVRLLVLCVSLLNAGIDEAFARETGEIVFDFIDAAGAEAGRYHNMMDQHGRFTDRFASPESIGRLIRALGITLRDTCDESWRERARRQLQRTMLAAPALSTEHARAFAVLGYAAAVSGGEPQYRAPLRAGAEAMLFELERNEQPGWLWPLPELTYDNARLPEALLRAGTVLGDAELHRQGLRELQFLANITQPHGRFEPIGAPSWFPRGGTRPYYSQQPLEALAMMEAWIAAGDDEAAHVAYTWFLGNNLDGLPLVDERTGSCYDGIHAPGELNQNMGAESTLAYLQAAMHACAASASEVVA